MRPPRHATTILSTGLVLGLLACGWFLFAPSALGGSTSWVVTDGISMEPRFHAGDLVLVRSESDYRVGQIVAYRNLELHTIVLHRIVARDGSRYVFKGDNNNFLDFEHPRRSQLIGAMWAHLPGAGGELASIRSPALIGGLFALATLLFGGAAFTRRRRRRRRERDPGEAPREGPPHRRSPSLPAPGVLAAGLAAMVPFVALALPAFTRPPAADTLVNVPYRQSGALGYSAKAPPGATYPDGRVRTGEPLFTHVVHEVELRFAYAFQSTARHRTTARASIAAEIASTSGWRTTIPLGTPRELSGGSGVVRATLDLGSLLSLIERVEATTAVRGTYTLTIVPHVTTSGEVGGAPIHASFSPAAKFSLNTLEVRPVATAGASSEAEPSAASFSHTSAGTLTARRSRPSELSLGAFHLAVATARTVSLIGIAILICALLAAAALIRPRRRGEAERILARYGSLIVPVARIWQQPGVAVIDVADFDSLARIAAHYDRSILHERAEYGDAFWVTDESGQFRFAILSEDETLAEMDAYGEEPLEEFLVEDNRDERHADTIEFGAASSYSTLAPQG
jgi:signal peptidase I